MQNPVTLSHKDRILTVDINYPPVNALALPVRVGLLAAMRAAQDDPEVDAVILQASGRTFVAGGDITEFDQPAMIDPHCNDVYAAMEQLDRPIIAALHGTVLGGGLELALSAHYRVALAGTQLGLPEVKLGIVPGAGGTQRLPRVAGVSAALDMMTSGAPISADRALTLGIVDEVAASHLREAALAMAQRAIQACKAGQLLPVISRRSIDVSGLAPGYFDDYRRRLPPADKGGQAAHEVVRCVEAAVALEFAQSLALERKVFEGLRLSKQSQALRHVFFAEREAARIPGLKPDQRVRSIARVGVLGAGTMGSGIAMNFANVGIPTVLVETSQAALDRGLGFIRGHYETSAAKGRLTSAQVAQRMSLLTGSLDDQRLHDCDLIIEAVFENLDLKKQVCARLGQVCKPGAIIATNTSTLDVDVLAQATGRAQDVVGLHFFSPAHVMRLLEVVRGAQTSPEVLATVMRMARQIGKVAVVSGVCYGFIGNRMAEVYMREAEFLMMEGASPAQIDGAVEAYGMAMGPCRMLDMAGVDVGARTVIEATREGKLGQDPRYRAVVRKLFELGRFGQKAGVGYYRYEGRKPVADPETARIVSALATQHGFAQRNDITDEEIVERLLYSMINEGCKILDEGIAFRASDIDIIWTAGYSFPAYRGGPMFMADQVGLKAITARLDHYAKVHGDKFGYWATSDLLKGLAEQGGRLSAWAPH
ncbi:MAG: enoyl-CoA hydratase [Rhodospirillaceae bacterium]|nr:MAG: enoyl-CoA hydratase [Rhodospirillaceae bacterium]